MEFCLCGKIFKPQRWNSDTWKYVQVFYAEQSWNKSPWEKYHKFQLVKQILLKPAVLERGQTRLTQCEVSDTEEQCFWRYCINNIKQFCRRNWRKLGYQIFCTSDHSYGKMSMLLNSPWGGAYFYPIRYERFQVLKIKVSMKHHRSASSETRTDTSNR